MTRPQPAQARHERSGASTTAPQQAHAVRCGSTRCCSWSVCSWSVCSWSVRCCSARCWRAASTHHHSSAVSSETTSAGGGAGLTLETAEGGSFGSTASSTRHACTCLMFSLKTETIGCACRLSRTSSKGSTALGRGGAAGSDDGSPRLARSEAGSDAVMLLMSAPIRLVRVGAGSRRRLGGMRRNFLST